MKKVIAAALVVVLLAGLISAGVVVAAGNGIRASKATAKVSELTLLEWLPEEPSGAGPGQGGNIPEEDYVGEWTTILTQNIKTPNQKDLFVGVSLETGLYTRTHVKSKRNFEGDEDWDSSTAHSKVVVRVLVDGESASAPVGVQEAGVAFPRMVTFNEREQTLSAKFMGIFTGESLIVTTVPIDNDGDGLFNEDPVDEVDNDGDGAIDEDPIDFESTVTIDYDLLEPEELELILNTMSANSFNFVVADLTPGNHVIEVQACIMANGSAEEGSYEAMAMVGQGSVVIEGVRMMKGEDYLDMPD
jgi:hypothetical protein